MRHRSTTSAFVCVTAALTAAGLAVLPTTASASEDPGSSAWDLASESAASSSAQAPALAPAVGTAVSSSLTLLTGDRVTLLTDDGGGVKVVYTPDSPHFGEPSQVLTLGDHTYVRPKLAASQARRLDPSVFDVTAIAAHADQVPLEVTFQTGVSPHDVAGLDVDAASAEQRLHGRVVAQASYDATKRSFTPLGSLQGVSHIALAEQAAAPAPQTSLTTELYTLTIQGTTRAGDPIPFEWVNVFNADNGHFLTTGAISEGELKMSVPAGNYQLVIPGFDEVVVHEVSVTADLIEPISLGEATVRPALTYPGHRQFSQSLDIVGSDEAGNNFWGYHGLFGTLPLVSPLPTPVAGRVHVAVGADWLPDGYHPYPDGDMANDAKWNPLKRYWGGVKVFEGIPDDLAFEYTDADFADVDIEHHRTGPTVRKTTDVIYSSTPEGSAGIVFPWPVRRPAVIKAKVAAAPGTRLNVWASAEGMLLDHATFQVDSVPVEPGQRTAVHLFRAPITPMADRGDEDPQFCSLCILDGKFIGAASLNSSAGTEQFGPNEKSTWGLYDGKRKLIDGHGVPVVSSFGKAVPVGDELRLVAETGGQTSDATLSTHVSDVWRFTAVNNSHVQLTRADYVPPTNLNSRGPSGRVSYPITFDTLGPIDARVAKASVQWSVNGKTWRDASLHRQDKDTFRVAYRNPHATKDHRYLSLKVRAKDVDGRSIFERVDHAYLLPRATARSAPSTAEESPAASSTQQSAFEDGTPCATPSRTRYACFVQLAPGAGERSTSLRAATTPHPWGARAIRDAYDLGADPDPGTIGIVVAYHYSKAGRDMNAYRAKFGLPACSKASGCFRQLNQDGVAGDYPTKDDSYGWTVEAALDLQMASAACPTCRIVLVEARQPVDDDLAAAEEAAVGAGATVTNHSYGRMESTFIEDLAPAYDHPGVTAVAASGDTPFGFGGAIFPSSSPDVVAVGGTVLARSTTDPRGWTERAWNHAQAGCSAYFGKPAGQTDTDCHNRTIADVSAVSSDVLVYFTDLPKDFQGWYRVSGTSASSPLIAGMIAAGGHGGLRPADLYAAPGGFHDVVGGSSGFCDGSYICTAVVGYDGPTGLGTPTGTVAFP